MKAKKPSLPDYFSQPAVQRVGSALLAMLVIASVAYFGTIVKKQSNAATPGMIYLSSANSSFVPGSNVTVDIRENSGSDAVTTVQASLTYDASQLQFVSISDGTAFPQALRTDSISTPGQVRIARAVDAGTVGVTGDQSVVRVTFKILSTSGRTSLSFDNTGSYIIRAGDSANIMNKSRGASYSVAFPAPTLTTVAPTSGLTTGGTAVTLTGNNFRPGATVTMGGMAATNVAVISTTQITAIAPAHAVGTVDIAVRNSDGQSSTKPTAFQYDLPAPAISSVVPVQGGTVGGTTVTITGSNFIRGATVRFGTTGATSVVYVSSSELTVIVPPRKAGIVAVTVTNPDDQTGSLANAFTYKLSGDFNGDGHINVLDYSALASHDGQNYPAADYNGDGIVDAADLAILLANWTW